jgi:hypothetical protein
MGGQRTGADTSTAVCPTTSKTRCLAAVTIVFTGLISGRAEMNSVSGDVVDNVGWSDDYLQDDNRLGHCVC